MLSKNKLTHPNPSLDREGLIVNKSLDFFVLLTGCKINKLLLKQALIFFKRRVG
jgi:hypothetical protein